VGKRQNLRVLATIDQFWRGGRETFLDTYSQALKQRGISLTVLAGTVDPNIIIPASFESFTAFPRARWLESSYNEPPDLLWAHHFGLLEALALSRRFHVPLQATFHGPLVGDSRPNPPVEALGITLAIFRGGGVSAVSEETANSIRKLHPKIRRVEILRNAVSFPTSTPKPQKSRGALLITRAEKLDHIRAGVLLFAEGYQKGEFDSLSLVVATPPKVPAFRNQWADLAQLLGRKWCLARMPKLIPVARRIQLLAGTDSPATLIQEHGTVFGMGRVVLEALAEDRRAVLIGYHQAIDVASLETIESMARSNFSGRGVDALPISKILGRLSDYAPPTPQQLTAFRPQEMAKKADELFKLTYKVRPAFENFDALEEVMQDPEKAEEVAKAILLPEEARAYQMLLKG